MTPSLLHCEITKSILLARSSFSFPISLISAVGYETDQDVFRFSIVLLTLFM